MTQLICMKLWLFSTICEYLFRLLRRLRAFRWMTAEGPSSDGNRGGFARAFGGLFQLGLHAALRRTLPASTGRQRTQNAERPPYGIDKLIYKWSKSNRPFHLFIFILSFLRIDIQYLDAASSLRGAFVVRLRHPGLCYFKSVGKDIYGLSSIISTVFFLDFSFPFRNFRGPEGPPVFTVFQ